MVAHQERDMRKLMATMVCALAALLPALTCGVAAAQGFIPSEAPPWVFAGDYGRWALQGQGANVWSFSPGSICQITQLNYQNKPTFYAFSNTLALAPVLVSDITSSKSEVVTPGSFFTPTQSSCGANLSPVNSHTTFTLQSGTGGLQEALNAVGGTATTSANSSQGTVIYLSKSWYGAISSIGGMNATLAAQVTPASVIASVTGSTRAVLVDITTAPFTTYVWNGSQYVVNGTASAALPNLRTSSYTQIVAPTALSTSSTQYGILTTGTTGGTIPASSTYRLAITYVDVSGGETLISTDSASTSTIATGTGTTNTISVTSPAAATGAVGYRVYMSAASGAAGSEILYTPTCSSFTNLPVQNVFPLGTVCQIGANATVTAVVTGTAKVPITGSAYVRQEGTTGSIPPFTALGTQATTVAGTLGLINFPTGWFNSLGRTLQACGNGYATTNATQGTLTLSTTLASVPGVTTITPFTAASGTTTASATVPFNFCVTYTTAATGATGTLEAHGWVDFGLAGTAVGTVAQDTVITVSSTVDLTKQNQLDFLITPTTTGTTAAQLRQLTLTAN
jgi:hypothetical protein